MKVTESGPLTPQQLMQRRSSCEPVRFERVNAVRPVTNAIMEIRGSGRQQAESWLPAPPRQPAPKLIDVAFSSAVAPSLENEEYTTAACGPVAPHAIKRHEAHTASDFLITTSLGLLPANTRLMRPNRPVAIAVFISRMLFLNRAAGISPSNSFR